MCAYFYVRGYGAEGPRMCLNLFPKGETGPSFMHGDLGLGFGMSRAAPDRHSHTDTSHQQLALLALLAPAGPCC